MRLDEAEQTAIRRAIDEALGGQAVVRLFGSRADDARAGGDIDLHVEIDDGDGTQAEQDFRTALARVLGDRRIDVVVHRPGTPDRPIDRLARRQGIPLTPAPTPDKGAVPMTDADVQALMDDHATAARLQADSLARVVERLSPHRPLRAGTIRHADAALAEQLDAFQLRFARLQDLLGRALFRDVLEADMEAMPQAMADIVAAMEKRGILADATLWQAVRGVRNALAHDYLTDAAHTADTLERALALAPDLMATAERALDWLEARRAAVRS